VDNGLVVEVNIVKRTHAQEWPRLTMVLPLMNIGIDAMVRCSKYMQEEET
jgi:hypothetical protein